MNIHSLIDEILIKFNDGTAVVLKEVRIEDCDFRGNDISYYKELSVRLLYNLLKDVTLEQKGKR